MLIIACTHRPPSLTATRPSLPSTTGLPSANDLLSQPQHPPSFDYTSLHSNNSIRPSMTLPSRHPPRACLPPHARASPPHHPLRALPPLLPVCRLRTRALRSLNFSLNQ
ncbi:hypothetical protein ARMGADRAFT_784746 [Armillaria gallica]|uniref:Uncharacterized protein n=1 Tax=Armillaria gallica TaxID=47427 RepID=A0A2H3CWZ1_ARMGA|nr:hypothetical protein ARMGADRAFT_784746 [Armillaria gallica]